MRIVRGAKALVKYLDSIQCPLSGPTIQKLVKVREIPFRRPSPRVLIFKHEANS
ncbi:hypothetical protein [Sporosarcina limicola]|uniref:Uncharacterized protein n=1 Tax=Sporosarcina limicola TaxID=34101 RepID=A0A927MHG5_9BACL|nr:hypothetical protein [Sporosarcina limicola]MBE1554764.1 hypothetical protein [Sporosarcina limicola]